MKTTTIAKKFFESKAKKDIMSYAWKLAKKQAVKDNCTARECFAWALKKAWDSLKKLCTAREGFHKDSRYGSFCRWDSDFADIADNFPNVCSKKWAVFDYDTKSILYVGTLSECEKFRWCPSWFEHFGHLEHTDYTQGFYCPLLWT
jgi:hypothetical protein